MSARRAIFFARMPDDAPTAAPTEIRLTQYSHGAGCGCKIAPDVLAEIIGASGTAAPGFPGLLVGNAERDDAAVLSLGDGTALISTTDFFMPIVDDARTFGQIAATNAISDVYAMGGTPLLAIAILGWPVDKLPAAVAGEVIAGARATCEAAGIPLAGGHSIDSPEPIFGLAVNGRVDEAHLKRNGGARAGDLLYLTKPLGVGILSTAQKRGILRAEHAGIGPASMTRLNDIGPELAAEAGVHAMTDVTGFGLLGHLTEMCAASDLAARLHSAAVPLLHPTAIVEYLRAGAVPGGTKRNLRSYGAGLGEMTEEQRYLLADPQTSGGLLIAVDPADRARVEAVGARRGLSLSPIGQLTARGAADALIALD